MKKLLLLLLFIPLVCFGQIKTAENNLKPDEKIKYYNKNWIETSKSKAKYYRTYLTNSYDSIFKIKDFNKNGIIHREIESLLSLEINDNYNTPMGKYRRYNNKGMLIFQHEFPKFNYRNQNESRSYFDKKSNKDLEGIYELQFFNKRLKGIIIYDFEKDSYYLTCIDYRILVKIEETSNPNSFTYVTPVGRRTMNKTGNGIYNLQETNNYLYKRYPEFSNTNTKKIKNDGG
jgi:hypothetical protein|tara:strand:- start:32 stop:724 length:693 start_codon:yes stop_codon:yes gene_type:complete